MRCFAESNFLLIEFASCSAPGAGSSRPSFLQHVFDSRRGFEGGLHRCVTDAVALVANCRLGKRALKFRDWGKVAATFCDLETGRAVRIAAKESSKAAAKEQFPDLPREEGQQKAYAQLPDDVLFSKEWVKVEIFPEDLPGFKGPRIVCAQCGEGINFKREVLRDGLTLCRACAGERYYSPS